MNRQVTAGTSKRKPTPRTDSIQPVDPSFLRRAATCASSVLVAPNHSVFQTSRRMSQRRCTAPGSLGEVVEQVELGGRQVHRGVVEA